MEKDNNITNEKVLNKDITEDIKNTIEPWNKKKVLKFITLLFILIMILFITYSGLKVNYDLGIYNKQNGVDITSKEEFKVSNSEFKKIGSDENGNLKYSYKIVLDSSKNSVYDIKNVFVESSVGQTKEVTKESKGNLTFSKQNNKAQLSITGEFLYKQEKENNEEKNTDKEIAPIISSINIEYLTNYGFNKVQEEKNTFKFLQDFEKLEKKNEKSSFKVIRIDKEAK